MTAAEDREELEAYVWRLFARRSKFPPGQLVTGVLAAADRYAAAAAAETLAAIERDCSTVATRRAALTAGDGKNYGATL
jgi:hypothetical protein